MFAIAFRVGARFTLFTVIVNDLLLLKGGEPLSVAVTVAAAVPASENPGVRAMFPVVALVVVTVMYVGPAAFVNVKASPSGSDLLITCFLVALSFTVMLLVALSVGGRFMSLTLMMNDLLLLRGGEPLSVAVTVTGYGPAASPNPGAAWTFPLVALVVVTVTNVGPAAFVNVKALPSASDPVIT